MTLCSFCFTTVKTVTSALQTRCLLHEATAQGNEAVDWTFAEDSGFVVRADALRTARWLPEHSEATGFALGKELLRCGELLRFWSSHCPNPQRSILRLVQKVVRQSCVWMQSRQRDRGTAALKAFA